MRLRDKVRIVVGDGPQSRVGEEAFERIMQVNPQGGLFSCQAVLPVMRKQAARIG